MNVPRRGWALPLAAVALLSTLALVAYGAAARLLEPVADTAATATEHPPPTVSSKVPTDVQIPLTFPMMEIPFRFFDDFSWQTFLALNWPAVEGKRGLPDPAKKLGEKSSAVVWETWKAAYELFQPGGAAPSEWDSFEALSPCKEIGFADAGKFKQLVSFSNFGSVLEDFNQAGFGPFPVGPLVAQNQTYVRYEVRMNKAQYDSIRGNPQEPKTALYLRQNLPPDNGAPLAFHNGSIVVKAAWREFRLPEEKHLLDRYYHVDALLVNRQTRACEKKIMGLVGLHLVHKTPERPQWIWSTFEHVDNVAVGACAPSGIKPTFNDPAKPQTGPGVNDLPEPINAANPPKPNPTPAQVVRELPSIRESTRKTNSLYQNHPLVRDTVWKNYELVATQWPSKPKAGNTGVPLPANNVANVTMETEFQSISCMSCHGMTQRTDFVWMLPIRAYPPTEHGLKPAVNALQENRRK